MPVSTGRLRKVMRDLIEEALLEIVYHPNKFRLDLSNAVIERAQGEVPYLGRHVRGMPEFAFPNNYVDPTLAGTYPIDRDVILDALLKAIDRIVKNFTVTA